VSFLRTKTSREIVKEGVLDAVKIGAAETYIGAFGIFLGGTPLQIGALATLPPLVGAMAQTVGMKFAEQVKSRRDTIVHFLRIQAVLVLSFAAITTVFGIGRWGILALIAVATLYQVTIGIVAPLWNSLVGDIVPSTSRGEFFGYRNTWMSIITFAAVVGGGQIIHFSGTLGFAAYGFGVVFAVAAVSRFLSARHFAEVPDETIQVPHDSRFSFWQFIRRTRHSNFVKFTLFVSAMNLATAISGPYFAMYMLKDLSFSYHEYTLVVAAAVLVQFAVMRSWGRLSDQFGNRKIMRIAGTLVSINPLLWLVSSKLWWVLLIQLYSGLFWSGFNLAVANFIFDAVSPQKRARCFAYQSIINGVAVFIGSILGGWLAVVLPPKTGESLGVFVAPSPFLILFALSALARVAAMLILFPTFKEVRSVQKIRSYELLIRVTSLRPLWGATFGLLSERRERER
jgi:MFS family permease